MSDVVESEELPPDPDAEGLIEVPEEDQPSQDSRDALDDIEAAELEARGL